MTAESFTALLGSRRSGSGKWLTRCPGHEDRSPSLSICEGQRGRVLLHCFAGCRVVDILSCMGLSRSDLFAGSPPSPEQLAKLQVEQVQLQLLRRKEREWLAEPATKERNFAAASLALAAKLALATEDNALTMAYHEALDKARRWELEGQQRSLLLRTIRERVTA